LSWGSVLWANGQLKYAISELKDAAEKGSAFHWKNTMCMVLIIKDRLVEQGFWWQAQIIEFWIHRYRAKLQGAVSW
jgi:hypothetical protein